MHAHRARSAIALSTALLVVVSLPITAGSAGAETADPPTFDQLTASIPDAEQALATAKATMRGRLDDPNPSLALRDLSARLPEYTGRDRVVADQLLARPNGGNDRSDLPAAVWSTTQVNNSSALCNTTVCVHWTDVGSHAPPPADNGGVPGVPDHVESSLAVMATVWRTEVVDYGYRPPPTDQRGSIDDDGVFFDVYLSDIGDKGYYGYCAPDDSRSFPSYKFFDRSSYCVLDEDFVEFPRHTPLQNLKVTAAHEFFHAIQFGYDAYEDGWFMEATAAWIEDEVFTNVNDNRQYLRASQFVNPTRPLDVSRGGAVYGGWGYFRYLSESYGRDTVRVAWQLADGAPGGPDQYSMAAVRRAIGRTSGDAANTFADFARSLLAPAEYFTEGEAYPSPRVRQRRLGGRADRTGWLRSSIDHLAIDYRSVKPTDRVGRGAKVKIRIDGPARRTNPKVRVLTRFRGGAVASRGVRLDRRGDGSVTVDFGGNAVKSVTAVLVNASDSYRRCYEDWTQYSCGGGIPRHDNRPFAVSFALR